MISKGEIKKKIENKDKKLMMMTSYLSLISIAAKLVQFTKKFSYFILTTLSTKTKTNTFNCIETIHFTNHLL
jgi:hypothetical protein